MGFILGLVRVFCVHCLNLEQREKALLVLGRTNLAGDEIAGLQVKTANLGRRDINILGAGEVIETAGAQEAEALRQYFQNTFREQNPGALGIFLQKLKNQFVFPHGAEIFDTHFTGLGVEVRHGHRLKFSDVHAGWRRAAGSRSGFVGFLRFDGTGRRLQFEFRRRDGTARQFRRFFQGACGDPWILF